MIGYLRHEYGSDPYTWFTKSSGSPAVLPNLHDVPAEQADIEASEQCRGNADGCFLEQRKQEQSSRRVVDIPERLIPFLALETIEPEIIDACAGEKSDQKVREFVVDDTDCCPACIVAFRKFGTKRFLHEPKTSLPSRPFNRHNDDDSGNQNHAAIGVQKRKDCIHHPFTLSLWIFCFSQPPQRSKQQ